MKLHFHIEGSGFGGNEAILLSLIPSLKQRGHKVVLSMEHGPCLQTFENIVDSIQVSGNSNILSAFLVDSKPDHFIGVHGKIFHLALEAKKQGVRTSWMVGHPSSLLDSGAFVASLGMMLFDQILFQSDFLHDDLVKLTSGAESRSIELRTILSGIDTGLFCPTDDAVKLETRRSLGIVPDEILLVTASRWVEYKNLPLMIDSFDHVSRIFPDTKLLILAPQHEPASQKIWKHLWARVEAHHLQNQVRFLSVQHAEMPRFLSASDIFFSCAKEEGLGCALLEGMACGLPIVAHKSGGVVEICGDGVGGYLTEKLESDAFAQAIIQLIRNPNERKSKGSLARGKVLQSFSRNRMIAEYEDALCRGLPL